MDPTAVTPGSSAADGLAGLIVAGSLIYLLVMLGFALLGMYISYRIMKAAVRNGTIEAIQRTGLVAAVSSAPYVQGYPPAQSSGAPPPPFTEV